MRIDDSLEPADVAALADAGLTAYHAAAKVARMTRPGDTCVVIGAKTPDQLQQNVDWFGTDLPDSLWSDLDAALANAPAA